MTGIEGLIHNKFDQGGTIHLSNDSKDERELLSQLVGLRIFELASDPAKCRLVLEQVITPTVAEHEAVQTVIDLLERFDTYNLQQTSALMIHDDIDDDLRVDIMAQSVSMTAILSSIKELLSLLVGAKEMDVLISKEMARALRIIRKGERKMDVEFSGKIE